MKTRLLIVTVLVFSFGMAALVPAAMACGGGDMKDGSSKPVSSPAEEE